MPTEDTFLKSKNQTCHTLPHIENNVNNLFENGNKSNFEDTNLYRVNLFCKQYILLMLNYTF